MKTVIVHQKTLVGSFEGTICSDNIIETHVFNQVIIITLLYTIYQSNIYFLKPHHPSHQNELSQRTAEPEQ